MKDTREQELIRLKKETDQQIKYNEEEHKRNMEKLEAEKKKKTDELKALVETNKNEEEKNRNALGGLIRQQFNEKIFEYDSMMEGKNKEREEQKVPSRSSENNRNC
ncbi:MAG: hypothetical protein P4L67_04065 [Candidatus Pacebacteria bacterium]|nr:hypothetical protein [Candidatus Paceibacterota bacterium]